MQTEGAEIVDDDRLALDLEAWLLGAEELTDLEAELIEEKAASLLVVEPAIPDEWLLDSNPEDSDIVLELDEP